MTRRILITAGRIYLKAENGERVLQKEERKQKKRGRKDKQKLMGEESHYLRRGPTELKLLIK